MRKVLPFSFSREEPARRLARSEGKLVDSGNLPKCPAIVLDHQMPIFPEPLCHGNEKKKPRTSNACLQLPPCPKYSFCIFY